MRSIRAIAFASFFLAAAALHADTVAELSVGTGDFTKIFAEAALDGRWWIIADSGDSMRLDGSCSVRTGPLLPLDEAAFALGFLYTRAVDWTVAGVELGIDGRLDQEAGTQDLGIRLGAPVTFNGEEMSWSIMPSAGIEPLSGGGFDVGLNADASFAACEFVCKPGIMAGYSFEWDGGQTLSVSPSFDVSWYPGIPVSAGIATECKVSLFTATFDVGLEYYIAASPAPWILLSLDGTHVFAQTGSSSSITAEAAVYPIEDQGVSIPVTVRFSDGFELAIGIRMEF